ncbi:MAG: iron-containing alcohol dehydrogenase [Deltaproteobacteria bacterium]|nr:iron-containing alcohol dehydrogenase [Deltaproteobacteria bacterium]
MEIILNPYGYRLFQYIMKYGLLVLPFPVPKVIRGDGSIKEAGILIKSQNMGRLLVVTDKGIVKAGLLQGLTKVLDKAHISYTVFDDVQPNPTIDNIEDGLKKYLADKCSGIIAIGGGSPIDCAKVIAARAANPDRSVKKMKGLFRVWHKIPPLIAIPTTAGTGSETTVAAVISDPTEREKFAIMDIKIVPHFAILDPALTTGLPPHLTAATGLDALTHAIEAYVSLHATGFTNDNAKKAVKIIFDNLEDVYHDGSNIKKREEMLMASFYGGSAFTRASIGYVHAIAHNLGGMYHVPHGLANAIVLPHVLEYSSDTIKHKLAELALVSGTGKKTDSTEALSQKFIDRIKGLNKRMNIPNHVKEIQKQDIPLLVKRILKEANPLYPVPKLMKARDCERVLMGLCAG